VGDRENHQHCVRKFIDLANELKDGGFDVNLVSAAMMAASGVYTTYAQAGNDGALEPSGVDKVVSLYRKHLEHIQEQKKAAASKAEEVVIDFNN
jgi:hypothetical protein